MILNLEEVFNVEGASKSFDYTLDLSAEGEIGGVSFVSPVAVKGSVKNRTGIVELRFSAVAPLKARCDRCDESFDFSFDCSFEHTLVTHINDEGNDEFLLVNEMMFVLDELVREDLLLNLPAKNLCSEECKGICFRCGKNLNDGPCDCKKEIDPRLAALQQLLES